MSVISGALGAKAQEHAAEDTQESARESNELQWKMYEQSRKDMLPWLTAGEGALEDLQAQIAEGPGEFTESPYYQQGLDEEQKAIDAYMASRGLYASGKAGKALTENARSNMQRNRQNWLSEWIQTKLNPSQSLAGLGQTAAGITGQQGITTGQSMGGNIMTAGYASGAGEIGRQNAWSQAGQGAANALAQYYGSKVGGSRAAAGSADEYEGFSDSGSLFA